MARTLWCRHIDCGKPYDSIGGTLPAICPSCQHVGAWATMPGINLIDVPKHKKRARPPFDLNANDKRLLQRLRIAQS